MIEPDGHDRADWGERLRLFRTRTGLKQEAAASLLGVSQAYVSRVENGSVAPSDTLIQRLRIVSRQPQHRPLLELIKTAVRHAPSLTTLLVLDRGTLTIEEHSRAFYGAGHPFDQHRRGSRFLWKYVGQEARAAMQALTQNGAFEGRIGFMEAVWTTAPRANGELRHFHTPFTPLRVDDGEWRLQASMVEITEDQKNTAHAAWGGPVRFFDYDEEPPFDWP
jgi:transcriptional regulator with XRE-family HTH domain